MNNKKMADMILELRKSKNMTQKQLAEKLNVTDKAVSKWERGMGCPDISLITSLSEALGISANELLSGERSDAPLNEADAIVETTLQYAKEVITDRTKSVKLIAKWILTITCFLGLFVCTICDIAISGTFSWSLYPILAITFGWLVIIPYLQCQKYSIIMSLISLSIFVLPFLVILDRIIGGVKNLLTLGLPITLVSLVYLWGIYLLFSLIKKSKFFTLSISLVLGVPVTLIINYILANEIGEPILDVWDLLTFGILGLLSFLFFFLGKRKLV